MITEKKEFEKFIGEKHKAINETQGNEILVDKFKPEYLEKDRASVKKCIAIILCDIRQRDSQFKMCGPLYKGNSYKHKRSKSGGVKFG